MLKLLKAVQETGCTDNPLDITSTVLGNIYVLDVSQNSIMGYFKNRIGDRKYRVLKVDPTILKEFFITA